MSTTPYYQGNDLYIENVSLQKIAKEFGTPSYIYSRKALEKNWNLFNQAFNKMNHRICYSVKANSNLAILHLLAKLGSGFDIVSLGELKRVLKAGGLPEKIVFSGVGKTEQEITEAMTANIYCFNVESEAEIKRIHDISLQKKTHVNIALRVNPNIDPKTHAHIATGLNTNKFGIDIDQVLPICKQIQHYPNLHLIGIASHIGSQITELEPFIQNIECLIDVYKALNNMGIQIQNLNIGGGLGIHYHHEKPPAIQEYAAILENKVKGLPIQMIIEPGRAIVGNAGVLLTRVEYLKHNLNKNFAIVDAGMNDLIRPALYEAWQDILPVEIKETEKKLYDIAGPVCESADFLGKNRKLALSCGDLLVIDSAGAYGFSMSSNYNSRTRPAEILVDNQNTFVIRRRETIDELFAAENIYDMKSSVASTH